MLLNHILSPSLFIYLQVTNGSLPKPSLKGSSNCNIPNFEVHIQASKMAIVSSESYAKIFMAFSH